MSNGLGASDVGVTADEVKVGVEIILSGPLGVYGKRISKAVTAAFRARNDAGGVFGRKITPIIEDTGFDAARGLAAGKKLVEQDKVFTLCCIVDQNTSNALIPYLESKGVPLIGSDGFSAPQYSTRALFPAGIRGLREGRINGQFIAEKLQAQRVGVLWMNIEGGEEYLKGTREAAERFGFEVAFQRSFAPDEGDFTPLILQLRQANVEVVSFYGEVTTMIKYFNATQRQNYKPSRGEIFNSGLVDELIPQSVGRWAEGAYGEMFYAAADQEQYAGVRLFHNTMRRYFPDWNAKSDVYTHLGWVQANLFIKGLELAGPSPTRAGIVDALEGLRNWDTGFGVALSIRPGTNHEANLSAQIMQLKDAKFVQVQDFRRDPFGE